MSDETQGILLLIAFVLFTVLIWLDFQREVAVANESEVIYFSDEHSVIVYMCDDNY